MTNSNLTLTVSWPEITLDRLSRVTGLWSQLILEISRAASGKAGNVRWVVASISYASPYRVVVAPEAASRKIPPRLPADVSYAIVNGIADLGLRPDVPDYFTPSALSITRKLAALTDATKARSMIVSNGVDRPAPLTSKVVAAIDDIVGPVTESFGTVEGLLQALNTHGRPRFYIWDVLGNRQIRCHFDPETVALDNVLDAYDQRVSISGRIRSKALTGERLSIDVVDFQRLKSDADLMSPDEILRAWGAS